MATLLKVLNNLADIKSAGVLHFASELRGALTHCSKINDLEGEPQMKGQYFALGLLSSVLLPIAADAQVVDRSLFAFGDAHTGPNVTATQIGNVTTIRSVNTPVTYNFANGVQVPGGTSAIYNLTATSVGAATSLSPSIFEQDYTGSFSITGLDDSNVLSGTFSEPLLGFDAAHSGSDNENQLQFSNFGNEGGWSFTSDISGLASNLNEDDQQIYFLGFFNASTLGSGTRCRI